MGERLRDAEQVEYLMRERCPYCLHEKSPEQCDYKFVRTYDGWKCCGYRTRFWEYPLAAV